MVNKCWKKKYSGKKMERFENKSGTELEIYSERINGKNVSFVAVSDSGSIKDKEFKTKPDAKRFAMKYMKNHC